MFKEKLEEAIHRGADQLTKATIKSFSEDEAKIFCDRIESDIARQKGATPRTYILEAKKSEKSLSYRLLMETEIWSSLSFN